MDGYGGSRVVRESEEDAITIIAAGITLFEALEAADTLSDEGINARIVDLYSVKPLDTATVVRAAEATGLVLTVEDHWPEGGIGEQVFATIAEAGLAVTGKSLAVRHMPGSATPDEELADAGIDASAIVAAARELVAADASRAAMPASVAAS